MAFRYSDADTLAPVPRDQAFTVRGYTLVQTAAGLRFTRHVDPETRAVPLPESKRVVFDNVGRPMLQDRMF